MVVRREEPAFSTVRVALPVASSNSAWTDLSVLAFAVRTAIMTPTASMMLARVSDVRSLRSERLRHARVSSMLIVFLFRLRRQYTAFPILVIVPIGNGGPCPFHHCRFRQLRQGQIMPQ